MVSTADRNEMKPLDTEQRFGFQIAMSGAQEGRVDLVEEFLDSEECPKDERLPALMEQLLVVATDRGPHMMIIEALLRRKACADGVLRLACALGNEELLELFLQAGGKVNYEDEDRPPLHVAVASRSLECVKLLLDHDAAVNGHSKSDNTTALFSACHRALPDIAALLVERGADVHAQAVDGGTPLHHACSAASEDCVQLLLKAGASPGATTTHGVQPLHVAAQAGGSKVVRILVAAGADVNCMFLQPTTNDSMTTTSSTAADNEDEEKEQVEKKIESEEKEKDKEKEKEWGTTPLHLAARIGDAAMVRTLLSLGADSSKRDEDGWTPLMCATQKGYTNAVRVFLSAKADCNATAPTGVTALHIATVGSYAQVVRLLVKAGADLEKREDMEDTTPLLLACSVSTVATIQELITSGADVTVQAKNGRTCLHLGCYNNGYTDGVVKVLVDAGAALNAVDSDGRTALHLAARRGHDVAVKYMVDDAGADVDVLDKEGLLADDEACVGAELMRGEPVPVAVRKKVCAIIWEGRRRAYEQKRRLGSQSPKKRSQHKRKNSQQHQSKEGEASSSSSSSSGVSVARTAALVVGLGAAIAVLAVVKKSLRT